MQHMQTTSLTTLTIPTLFNVVNPVEIMIGLILANPSSYLPRPTSMPFGLREVRAVPDFIALHE